MPSMIQYNSFTRGKDEILVILQNFMNSYLYITLNGFFLMFSKLLARADKIYRIGVPFYVIFLNLS